MYFEDLWFSSIEPRHFCPGWTSTKKYDSSMNEMQCEWTHGEPHKVRKPISVCSFTWHLIHSGHIFRSASSRDKNVQAKCYKTIACPKYIKILDSNQSHHGHPCDFPEECPRQQVLEVRRGGTKSGWQSILPLGLPFLRGAMTFILANLTALVILPELVSYSWIPEFVCFTGRYSRA